MIIRLTLTDEPTPGNPERLRIVMESDDPVGVDMDNPQTAAARVAVACLEHAIAHAEIESVRPDDGPTIRPPQT